MLTIPHAMSDTFSSRDCAGLAMTLASRLAVKYHALNPKTLNPKPQTLEALHPYIPKPKALMSSLHETAFWPRNAGPRASGLELRAWGLGLRA